jgi:hypothetical protein
MASDVLRHEPPRSVVGRDAALTPISSDVSSTITPRERPHNKPFKDGLLAQPINATFRASGVMPVSAGVTPPI